MKNQKVAKILNEIANFLEIKGDKYRPRAYRYAARTVESLSRDIKDIKKQDKLEELPGIGKNIAQKIEEIIDTGSLRYLEDMKKELSIELKSLLAVEGIGPKTIKLLYDELGVKNLDDLERMAKRHRIRRLKGMGEKTEKRILESIEFARKNSGRNLLGYTLPIAENLKNELMLLKVVDRVEIAGSIRRRKETVGDIDILVTTNKAQEVMNFFTSMENVENVISKGKTKSSVILKDNIESDLRVVDNKLFEATLLYFTGSKETNIEMRKIAIKKGLKLNDYGLFKGGKRLNLNTEKEIFQRLGMEFIEPELRENRGEIEAAMEGKLPELIGYDDLRGDLQMHSQWSDGYYSIEEMAIAARDWGHDYIAITDHTGLLQIAGGMSEEEIMAQTKEIEQLNDKIDGIKILKGIEANIKSNGELDVEDGILKDLDVVMASIHSGFRQDKEKLTNRIISAMENENVNIIAHPTGRKIQERRAYDLDLQKIFEVSRETNTFLEINSYPNRLDLSDINVKRAIETGCKLVINTDSHKKEHLKYIKLGIATARRGWAKKGDIINTLPLRRLNKLFN
ncbi:MAG: DNA polymerase/3'-5' exonuclease PolX [Euryarchaeota archaeon]|nr:DNA polymerase/3'-5' exonuclease PolX [Euryarchaeota archaeon]